MAEKVNKQLDLQQIALLKLVLENLSAAPGSPVNGRVYYDTVLLRSRVYINGGWQNFDNTGVELTANKNIASGYAPLDGAIRLPTANLPTVITAAGITGAVAASRYAGATASGAPASGTFAVGDFVVDQTGNIYICTVAGSPGTWLAVLRFGTTSTTALAGNTPVELTTNKGTTNGYAALVSGTVPIAQVPTAADGVSNAALVPLSNDSRLSNTRTPTALSVTDASVSASAAIAESKLALATDASAVTGSRRTIGTGALQAMAGNTTLATIAVPGASVNLNSQKITNLLAGTANNDAVNVAQLQASMTGITGVKDPVRAASVDASFVAVNVNIASPGTTIGNVTMATNDRFLAPNQTTGTESGIYIWNGAAVPATRAPDADATGEILDGTIVSAAEGYGQGKQFMQTATPSGAPGAWSQVWTVSNISGTAYTGSNGILLTGANFTAVKDTTDATNPIAIGANGIKVGTVPIDHGGTGAITAPLALAALGAPRQYSALMGAITAGGSVVVNHALNTLNTVESFRVVATGAKEMFQVVNTDANNLTITSEVAITASTYQVTVFGMSV